IYALALSPDGSLLAHAGFDTRIHVVDFSSRTPKCFFDGHSGIVHSLGFSPDGRRLVSSGNDGTVRIWDIPSQKAVVQWPDPHSLPVDSAVFSPGGDCLFSSNSSEVRRWTTDPGSFEPVIETGQESEDLEISPNGKWLVTSASSNSD